MPLPHISVCICTYKRPLFLKQLLEELACQETDGLFTFSIVIVDNDRLESGRPVWSQFAGISAIRSVYRVEARQGISLARNMAVANADGDLLALIDDDELPIKRWLCTLFKARETYQVAGVLGPVKPTYHETPPGWIVKGKFYDRPTHPTGFRIGWKQGRTGNCLLNRSMVAALDPPFRPEFRTGEDQDFYRRLMDRGHTFVWCDEALAYEVVEPQRWKLSVMVRRALLRGAISVLHPNFGARDILKSLIAIPLYSLALPFLFIVSQSKGMVLLMKLFDHTGRLMAQAGFDPVKVPYVTE